MIRAGSQQARAAGYRKAYLSQGRDGQVIRASSQHARRAGTIKHAGGHYGAGGKGGYVSVGYGGRRGGGHVAVGYGTGGKGGFDVRGYVYGNSGSYAIGVGYGHHATYGYGGHHRYGRYRHYPYFRGYPYYASHYAYNPYYGYCGHPYHGYGLSVAYGWPYFSMGIYYSRPYREAPMVSDGLYARAAGSLEIDIEPGGAFVKIDGKAIGRARDFSSEVSALSLAEGTHTVEIYLDGYMTLLLNLEIQAGGYYRLEERLFEGTGLDPRSSDQPVGYGPAPEEDAEDAAPQVQGASGVQGILDDPQLTVRASPPDAAVYLDGELLGIAGDLVYHGAIRVPVGGHTVQVVRPGYQTQTRQFDVGPEEALDLQIDLMPSS